MNLDWALLRQPGGRWWRVLVTRLVISGCEVLKAPTNSMQRLSCYSPAGPSMSTSSAWLQSVS